MLIDVTYRLMLLTEDLCLMHMLTNPSFTVSVRSAELGSAFVQNWAELGRLCRTGPV
jgi:hypothetical protein